MQPILPVGGWSWTSKFLLLGILTVFYVIISKAEDSDEFVNYYNYHEPIGELPCLKHGSRCNVIRNEANTACCNSNPIYPPCYDFKFITGQCRWVMCRYPNGQGTHLKYCLHWNYFKYNFKWSGDSHRSGGRTQGSGSGTEMFSKEINPMGPEEQANRHSELQQQISEQYNMMQNGGDNEVDHDHDHQHFQQQMEEQLGRIEAAIQ